MIDVNIDGDGILADLYKTIIQTFKPVAKEMNMDTMSCLPNPWPPNYDCYQRISNIKIINTLKMKVDIMIASRIID